MNPLEKKIGYSFNNKKIALQALTHSSISSNNNYEKLEFLGDSIIYYYTTIWLIRKFPNKNEAELSIKRSQIINKKKLSKISKSLNLYKHLNIDKNIKISDRINCDIFESIIGGIYIDSDIEVVSNILNNIFNKEIINLKKYYDFKGLIISLYNKNKISNYQMTSVFNKNLNFFICQLRFNNFIFYGFGRNKKSAEQQCSKYAYNTISKTKI